MLHVTIDCLTYYLYTTRLAYVPVAAFFMSALHAAFRKISLPFNSSGENMFRRHRAEVLMETSCEGSCIGRREMIPNGK
jgi:hypothetical protein